MSDRDGTCSAGCQKRNDGGGRPSMSDPGALLIGQARGVVLCLGIRNDNETATRARRCSQTPPFYKQLNNILNLPTTLKI